MEFRINVVRVTTPVLDGWETNIVDVDAGVALRDPDKGAGFASRWLSRVTAERRDLKYALPMPPEAEVANLAADAPHRQICVEPAATLAALEEIVTRRVGDTKRFGRYLFDTLIGTARWRAMVRRAGQGPLEVSLAWNAADPVFNRLPWEMMHNGTRFIAQEAKVAIVRRCLNAEQEVGELSSPPKVLFVVGTDLQTEGIQPGAEYLRLLQGLRAAGLDLSLQTRLLLRASVDSLVAAIKEFLPDVVHIVCHGVYDKERRPFLQFVDPKNTSQPAPVYPLNLLQALSADGKLPTPRIVVLNACYSASQDLNPGQVSAPYAAEIVAGGVPVAVGMAGRVMDQACRLFTRGFYQALLSGGDIAHAAAEGRRAAVRGGYTNPERTVDWTMPTIFLADGIKGTKIEVTTRDAEQTWHAVAGEFSPGVFPPFCDRLDIIDQFDLLLAKEETQKARLRGGDLQTLVISCVHGDGPEKYGRTWLLKELAAKALRDGHVPCLVSKKDVAPDGQWPRTTRDLLQWVTVAVDNTVSRFDARGVKLAGPFCPHLRAFAEVPKGRRLPATIAANLPGNNPDELRVQAAALRLDLRAFLEVVRGLRPEAQRERMRLVLLIDDLHNTSADLVSGLDTLVAGPNGLRQARDEIRLVLLYSAEATKDGQKSTIDKLAALSNAWMQRVKLDGFRPPVEEREAYQYFLLNWHDGNDKKPLMLVDPEAELSQSMFLLLREKVKGIPSNLAPEAPAVVAFYLHLSKTIAVLREAHDDELVEQAMALQRDPIV